MKVLFLNPAYGHGFCKSARWFAAIQSNARGAYSFAASPEAGGGAVSATDAMNLFDPTLFLYESFPGGVGFSAKLFERHEGLVAGARDLIGGCPCEAGCPSCVGPMPDADPRLKEASLALLTRLAGPPPEAA